MPKGLGRRGCGSGKGADAAVPAARDRAHPEDGEWSEAEYRALRSLREARTGVYAANHANLEVDEVFTIGMNRAVQLLAEKVASRGGRGAAAKPLQGTGRTPRRRRPGQRDGGALRSLRQMGKDQRDPAQGVPNPTTVTMEMAVQLIAEKAAKKGRAAERKPAKHAKRRPPKKRAAARKKRIDRSMNARANSAGL